jgi:hypothetical protein
MYSGGTQTRWRSRLFKNSVIYFDIFFARIRKAGLALKILSKRRLQPEFSYSINGFFKNRSCLPGKSPDSMLQIVKKSHQLAGISGIAVYCHCHAWQSRNPDNRPNYHKCKGRCTGTHRIEDTGKQVIAVAVFENKQAMMQSI